MKRTISAILAALLLTGCADSIESSAPEVTTSVAEQTTSAPQTTTQAEPVTTTPEQPEETATLPEESLLQSIGYRAAEERPDAVPDVVTVFFEDFDGDGDKDLIAADGGMEIHDGVAYYYGNLWQIYEAHGFPVRLRVSDGSAMTAFKRITVDGDELFSFELYSDTSEYNRTELWQYDPAFSHRIAVDGSAQLCITQTDDREFTAFATGYGANTDGTGRVYLPYDLHYVHYPSQNRKLVQYRYREITFDEYLEYCCGFGQSILYMILNDNEDSKINSYYLSENNKLVINYTVGEQLRYALCEWENGPNTVDMDVNNLGNFPVDITFEQQRLEQLILDSIPEEQKLPDGEIVYSLFGDLDGDGTEEIVSAYTYAQGEHDPMCHVWTASGNTAEFISTGEILGTISTPDSTFLKLYFVAPYGLKEKVLLIKDSTFTSAMPEGIEEFTYLEYNEESGFFYGDQLIGYHDDSGEYYKHRMIFDTESGRLKVVETVEPYAEFSS